MSAASWHRVDDWIVGSLVGDDPAMEAILEANMAAGLPGIDVSRAQGKLLHLMVRMSGARRVLEVGTLGAYSTAWMARALPPGGRLVTLEIDTGYAEVAWENLRGAGLGDKVEVTVGPALDTLRRLAEAGGDPFDFVFIDADKGNNANYLRLVLALSRPGTVIVCDNVVREGRVLDESGSDEAVEGTRALFDELSRNPRLSATAIQTVGSKGWDGFAIAIVEDVS